MICGFIPGAISNRVWNCLRNAASGGQNGMWAVFIDERNITGFPALVGVVFPSWKRFQLIRGKQGLTIYGEDENTISGVESSLNNMLNFANEQIQKVSV